jgi:hypothetical protein
MKKKEKHINEKGEKKKKKRMDFRELIATPKKEKERDGKREEMEMAERKKDGIVFFVIYFDGFLERREIFLKDNHLTVHVRNGREISFQSLQFFNIRVRSIFFHFLLDLSESMNPFVTGEKKKKKKQK